MSQHIIIKLSQDKVVSVRLRVLINFQHRNIFSVGPGRGDPNKSETGEARRVSG